MHEGRFFGKCLIVAIRFFKHEISAWKEFAGRLKKGTDRLEVGPMIRRRKFFGFGRC